MRTLVLQGSPHKKGDTQALVDALCAPLDGTIDTLWAYDGGIHPCIDCRRCWTQPGCIYSDPLQDALAQLDAYQAIILASPLYFSTLSGMLLAAVSRFQQCYAAYAFRGMPRPAIRRAGAIVLAGGGDGSMGSAEATGRMLLRQVGAAHVGTVISHDTNHRAAREDAAAISAAKALGEMLHAWRA